jgi:hypothetical protein
MYDLSLSEWFDSSDSRSKGMTFTRGFFDASIILVQQEDKTGKENFSILSFMDPFSYGVWLMLLGTLLVSSWFTYALQKLSGRHTEGNM